MVSEVYIKSLTLIKKVGARMRYASHSDKETEAERVRYASHSGQKIATSKQSHKQEQKFAMKNWYNKCRSSIIIFKLERHKVQEGCRACLLCFMVLAKAKQESPRYTALVQA